MHVDHYFPAYASAFPIFLRPLFARADSRSTKGFSRRGLHQLVTSERAVTRLHEFYPVISRTRIEPVLLGPRSEINLCLCWSPVRRPNSSKQPHFWEDDRFSFLCPILSVFRSSSSYSNELSEQHRSRAAPAMGLRSGRSQCTRSAPRLAPLFDNFRYCLCWPTYPPQAFISCIQTDWSDPAGPVV